MTTTNNYKLLKNLGDVSEYIKELKGSWEPLKNIMDSDFESPGGCTMGDVNHCTLNGAMSVCSATNLRNKEKKFTEQEKCNHFIKATYDMRCMWETFEEYCWSIKAQTAASKGK